MAKKFTVEQKTIRSDLLECNNGQVRGVPKNPRFIRNKRFDDLKQSIADDPEFLQVRELVVYPLYNGKFCILAGNMRFRAAVELGILNFPCKVVPAGVDSKKLRALVIKDNVSFGQDDSDLLANDWDISELASFGFEDATKELDALADEINNDDSGGEERKDFGSEEETSGISEECPQESVPDLIFPTDNELGIPVLDLSMQATECEAPFMSFGFKRGWRELARTLHFFIDDYRFNKVWSNPAEILGGGIKSVVEPNFSVSHVSPRAFAAWCFFKKRWLNRFWQSQGLKTFADLNVPPCFIDLALTGVPDGWGAYFTRGIKGDEGWIEAQLSAAKKRYGKKNPLFCVYGGGKTIEDFCNKRGLIFINELHEGAEYTKQEQ